MPCCLDSIIFITLTAEPKNYFETNNYHYSGTALRYRHALKYVLQGKIPLSLLFNKNSFTEISISLALTLVSYLTMQNSKF